MPRRLAAPGVLVVALALAGLAHALPARAEPPPAADPDGVVTLLKFVACAIAMASAKTWIAATTAMVACGQVIASQKTGA